MNENMPSPVLDSVPAGSQPSGEQNNQATPNRWLKTKNIVALVMVIALAVVTVGIIWYIRQQRQPLAPTAPPSKPKAEELVCSFERTVSERCLNLEEIETDDDSTVQFSCEGLPGTDYYQYYVRYSPDDAFELLSSSTDPDSAVINLNDYTQVYCQPCAGDYCATEEQSLADCSYEYEVEPSPTPTPTPTPAPQCNSDCVTDADCPSDLTCTTDGFCRNSECSDDSDCECDLSAGFVIEKYHDQDGDGTRDNNEPGLDWTFKWKFEGDGDNEWEEYETYASKDGRGGNIDDLDPDKTVIVREDLKGGWEPTTEREIDFELEEGKRKIAVFGNWQPPNESTPEPTTGSVSPSKPKSSTPTSTPTPKPVETLPQAGTATQTAALVIAGLAILAVGWRFLIH